jgi:pyrroline-5-carboxylate reductase
MNICFIGFGSMAKAIARGLVKDKQHHLSASAPSLTLGVNHEGIHTFANNIEAIKGADLVILAVKPGQMDAVLKEIAPELSETCLLISVAAGLNMDWYAKYFSKPQAMIRTMPNTPASIGLGATPMIANHHTHEEQKKWAEIVFSSIGLIHWLADEAQMSAFTALSGSGPAYVFLFVEALVAAAVDLGVDGDIAKIFALQTCKGAIQLAEESDFSLSELRTRVTSPSGTTAAALNVLHPPLEKLILSAMRAATVRSQELGLMY